MLNSDDFFGDFWAVKTLRISDGNCVRSQLLKPLSFFLSFYHTKAERTLILVLQQVFTTSSIFKSAALRTLLVIV